MGWYDEYNLKQYDPGYYFDKYSYKPQKRVSGYLGKAFHAKKVRNKTGHKFHQAFYYSDRHTWNNCAVNRNCKGN